MSRLASAFRAMRSLIFVSFFAISLIFNITLLASNFVFGVASSAFSALTGTRTLMVRQADEIASLNANLMSERQIKRELRGEVAEVSSELAAEKAAHAANRQVVREVRTELAETSTRLATDQAELVASRRVQRELRGEVAEVSTELATERAAHAANRQIVREVRTELAETSTRLATGQAELVASRRVQRELRSTSAELSRELISTRASRSALRDATRATAGRIAERNRRSAVRNVASMPGEALPWLGTAVIVGVTALELSDLCQTMIDMKELQELFDPNLETPEDQLTVCNMEVPSKQEIWEIAKNSPATAWNAARNVMPTAEDLKELPDFEWTTFGEVIEETSSDLTETISETVVGKFDQLSNWWNE